MMTGVPNSWQSPATYDGPGQWHPMHRQAWEACQANARDKPRDCTCCGCHTGAVDKEITDATVQVMIRTQPCPAERRALARILASRI